MAAVIARAQPMRPCLDCGALGRGTRCARHERARQRVKVERHGSAARRGYDRTWRTRARAAVAQHIETYGYLCPGYQRASHPSQDLTADHREPLARGGTGDVIDVLCRACNASKGARA